MPTYTAKIVWRNDSPDAFTRNQYTRGHTWLFDGGVEVPASSSPHAVRVPFSVEAAVDPEEALVASASSCHMLTFLWLAARKGVQYRFLHRQCRRAHGRDGRRQGMDLKDHARPADQMDRRARSYRRRACRDASRGA